MLTFAIVIGIFITLGLMGYQQRRFFFGDEATKLAKGVWLATLCLLATLLYALYLSIAPTYKPGEQVIFDGKTAMVIESNRTSVKIRLADDRVTEVLENELTKSNN